MHGGSKGGETTTVNYPPIEHLEQIEDLNVSGPSELFGCDWNMINACSRLL